MADGIVANADRTPKWDKWQLMRRITVWQFVCLSLNKDPDNPPGELLRTPRFESYDRRPVREALYQEFKDRTQVVFSNLDEMADADTLLAKGARPGSWSTVVEKRKAVAFVAGTGWRDVPHELLDMADEQPAADAPLHESEKDSLLKMVLGMAMAGYGYTPGAARNAATGEKNGSIAVDLERLGLTLDADTLRKFLNEAEARFSDILSEPRKH